MRTKLFILAFVALILASCKTKIVPYPVEVVKTEYKDKYHRDSVYRVDSIYYAVKGDTIYKERYQYIYKDVIIRDSIVRVDSIPYPVEVPGEPVNYVTGWQNFRIWLGNIFLILLGVGGVYLIARVKRKQ